MQRHVLSHGAVSVLESVTREPTDGVRDRLTCVYTERLRATILTTSLRSSPSLQADIIMLTGAWAAGTVKGSKSKRGTFLLVGAQASTIERSDNDGGRSARSAMWLSRGLTSAGLSHVDYLLV